MKNKIEKTETNTQKPIIDNSDLTKSFNNVSGIRPGANSGNSSQGGGSQQDNSSENSDK